MAERFHCTQTTFGGRVTLDDHEAHHLARVRRISPGTLVELFDGRSPTSQLAQIASIEGRKVELELVGDPIPGREPPLPLILLTSVPKGERFDWLVEKAVEIGVGRLVPLTTARSVVDPRASKLDRLRRTIVEASKQCGRNRLMELDPTGEWKELARSTDASVLLMADPAGLPLQQWPVRDTSATVALAVGPEGGFSPDEVDIGRRLGWVPVRLSSSVLRIETAAIVGAAIALAHYGGNRS